MAVGEDVREFPGADFPGPRRAKAVALYGATAGIGASLGLVIGGALADWVSCRAAPVGA